MDANKILLGLFIGVMAISLFTPVLTIYGFNQTTSMVLLYLMPIVGAATAISIDIFKEDSMQKRYPKNTAVCTSANESVESNPDITGKWVAIESSSGNYRGIVKSLDSSMLSLENASRTDLPEPSNLDRVFLERSSVRKIELLQDTIRESTSHLTPPESGKLG